MTKKKRNLVFTLVGIYFIIISILDFVHAFIYPETASPLWFCYFAVLLIGIGILARKSNWILMQVNILTIPILLWDIDFFYQLITKQPLWGLTDFFFATGWVGSLSNFLVLQHLYVLPTAFVFVYLLGIHKKDLWKWSFIELVLIFLAGSFFSVYEKNVNCIFKSCINFITIPSPYYQIFWFFSVFVMVFLTNLLVIYLAKKLKKLTKK